MTATNIFLYFLRAWSFSRALRDFTRTKHPMLFFLLNKLPWQLHLKQSRSHISAQTLLDIFYFGHYLLFVSLTRGVNKPGNFKVSLTQPKYLAVMSRLHQDCGMSSYTIAHILQKHTLTISAWIEGNIIEKMQYFCIRHNRACWLGKKTIKTQAKGSSQFVFV